MPQLVMRADNLAGIHQVGWDERWRCPRAPVRPPVVGMRCWNRSVFRTAVPEAAVDEDGESLTSEDDVRAPAFIAPRCIVDAIAQTASVE